MKVAEKYKQSQLQQLKFFIIFLQQSHLSMMQEPTQSNQAFDKKPQPLKSIEGWIIIATNLEEQIMQDDVFDAFSNYGQIKSLHLNFDRRTGYAKGYVLIQYGEYEQAEQAIKKMNGNKINQKILKVDWAFKTAPIVLAKK